MPRSSSSKSSTKKSKLAQLIQKAKDTEQPEPVEYKDEFTEEEIEKFLQYEVNFGKYKGKTWAYVYVHDSRYFKWAVYNTEMEKYRPKTYAVFNYFITGQGGQVFTD